MKAFWWFEDNFIAGMARPGFNYCRWFDLPFDEAVAMGWVGQHSLNKVPLDSFRKHLEIYAPKIFPFYQLDEKTGRETLKMFEDAEVFNQILGRLAQRSQFMTQSYIADDHLHLELHTDRLYQEIEFLKSQGIRRIVSLTENHHSKDILSDYFDLHHMSIIDMGAPTVDQVQELKEVIELSEKRQEKIAVHCLAGIGRTSTMLMGAQLLRGKKLQDLIDQVSQKNPSFTFTGPQADFIRKLAAAHP